MQKKGIGHFLAEIPWLYEKQLEIMIIQPTRLFEPRNYISFSQFLFLAKDVFLVRNLCGIMQKKNKNTSFKLLGSDGKKFKWNQRVPRGHSYEEL